MKNSQVCKICKSLSGLLPSVPPKTNRLSPTVVQLWLSLGVGGVPFSAGSLQYILTEHTIYLRKIKSNEKNSAT